MAMKYFGYTGNGDPRQNAVYSVTTGSGATAGSFNVVFRIPVEAVARTGVGALQNQTTQSPLTLSATVNKLASIYSTAPTAAPAVTVKYKLGGYWNGSNPAYSPTPKAFGSTQYINRSSHPRPERRAAVPAPEQRPGQPGSEPDVPELRDRWHRAGSAPSPTRSRSPSVETTWLSTA